MIGGKLTVSLENSLPCVFYSNFMSNYFGIGIENLKTDANLGTLWRSAHSLGASFIFVIGRRYKTQGTDTGKAWRSIPLYEYQDFNHFVISTPKDCLLIGIENCSTAIPIKSFSHPKRAIYLLGAEDNGLTKNALNKCHKLVIIPGSHCLNVAVAGSIIMYDRVNKGF